MCDQPQLLLLCMLATNDDAIADKGAERTERIAQNEPQNDDKIHERPQTIGRVQERIDPVAMDGMEDKGEASVDGADESREPNVPSAESDLREHQEVSERHEEIDAVHGDGGESNPRRVFHQRIDQGPEDDVEKECLSADSF